MSIFDGYVSLPEDTFYTSCPETFCQVGVLIKYNVKALTRQLDVEATGRPGRRSIRANGGELQHQVGQSVEEYGIRVYVKIHSIFVYIIYVYIYVIYISISIWSFLYLYLRGEVRISTQP